MRSFERKNIKSMVGYTPGEQPEVESVIKLNTNENPYPPPQSVADVLSQIDVASLRRYPSPSARQFRKVAAKLHHVKPENIIATNGGDELLRLLLTTFVEVGSPIGVADPSYSLYPVLAAIHDSPVRRVSLTSDWELPDDFAEQMNAFGVKLSFVVNPHAPSGKLVPVTRLTEIAQKLDGILVIDEAYVDFIDPDQDYNSIKLINQFDNIVILRTLSKGYSLAGLRFGYGIGPARLIEPMQNKTKDSYNMDLISQKLGVAALQDQAAAKRTWQAVCDERSRMVLEFDQLGLTSLPSQANFLLVEIPSECAGGAEALYQTFKNEGVLVRFFNEERLKNKLRITVGTPQENSALLQILKTAINK